MGALILVTGLLALVSFAMVDGWMKIVHLKRLLEIEKSKTAMLKSLSK